MVQMFNVQCKPLKIQISDPPAKTFLKFLTPKSQVGGKGGGGGWCMPCKSCHSI